MALVATGYLCVAILLTGLLRKGTLAEELIRCFDGTATTRLSCALNESIWVKTGFYGVAQDFKFCRSSETARGRDCLPNEQGHRWTIATDCNMFSTCVSYNKHFQTEAATTCKVNGPTYSQVDYECISRLSSNRKDMIEYIYLSSIPSQDVVNDKLFLMSERYTSPTSGETGSCQLHLPARTGAHFHLLDLRGRTIPASTERCPYKLYIYSAGNYREWCAGSTFEPNEFTIQRSSSESIIDVVFERMVTNGNAAVWLLMEGKSDDGSAVTGLRVNCGSGVVLQSLEGRKTIEGAASNGVFDDTLLYAGTSRVRLQEQSAPPEDIPNVDLKTDREKVYYIFKSTMAAKIPGADGVVDNLAISRDSKGVDPLLRMSVYSRDFGQQWYQDGQRIMNRVDNKCMAVNEKNQLVLVQCLEKDKTQHWIFQRDLGVFKSAELGDVVEITNNQPNSGALLGVGATKENAAYQKFTFELAPTYFLIVNKSSGMVATLASVAERSKIVMEKESMKLNDSQVFYSDKKDVIRCKINNYAIDTRSGTAVALRFLGVNKDNNWTYNSTVSKIINKGEIASPYMRVLRVKPDLTLGAVKSSDDPSQIFDIRIVD